MLKQLYITFCCLPATVLLVGQLHAQAVSANYFQGDEIRAINTSSSAFDAVTIELDTECEQVRLTVPDPTGAPLEGSKPILVRIRDANGDQVSDLSGRLSVTMRVRSAGAFPVALLLRSGDGSSDFRTARKSFDVPAGLDEWTEATVTFETEDLGPNFDPTDIRDLWIYLDRSMDNFPGNNFYVDHIVIGGAPDADRNSPCLLGGGGAGGGGGMDDNTYVDYFQADSLTSFFTDNRAGRASSFDLDTVCELVNLTVVDPVNNALPPFNAYQIDPLNDEGEEITDATGSLSVTMRVRSLEAVNFSILLRSGEGTPEDRTDRLAVDVPGGLEEWTDFTVTFTEAEFAGFDPTTFRDIWFYLDRGEPNFAGNFFSIDHIALGQAPDSTQNSPCNFESRPTPFTAQFTGPDDVNLIGGTEAGRLTLAVTACEELLVSVTEPTAAALGAFRPLVTGPVDAAGAAVRNVAGLTDVYIRARSNEAVPISVLFRSGDGSSENRSETITQTVQADSSGWSNLVFSFAGEDLGGFDPLDLLDVWIYLDRDNENFPGNELYIDYVAIGEQPDTSAASPCGLPDLTVSTSDLAWAGNLRVYPNPASSALNVEFPELLGGNESLTARLLDMGGRAVVTSTEFTGGNLRLDVSQLPRGVYFLQLVNARGASVIRKVLKQ